MKRLKTFNNLASARRERGLSRKTVARLIRKDWRTIAAIERGDWNPSLAVALQFEILYRTPIAFLYPEMYCALRNELRSLERDPRVRRLP